MHRTDTGNFDRGLYDEDESRQDAKTKHISGQGSVLLVILLDNPNVMLSSGFFD